MVVSVSVLLYMSTSIILWCILNWWNIDPIQMNYYWMQTFYFILNPFSISHIFFCLKKKNGKCDKKNYEEGHNDNWMTPNAFMKCYIIRKCHHFTYVRDAIFEPVHFHTLGKTNKAIYTLKTYFLSAINNIFSYLL